MRQMFFMFIAISVLLSCAYAESNSLQFTVESLAQLPPHATGYAKHQRHVVQTIGGGVSVLDIDNNGWLDLIVSSGANGTQVLHNEHGRLSLSQQWLDPGEISIASCVGDINHDGLQDIVETRAGKNRIWMNQADDAFQQLRTFEDRITGISTGCVIADFNADGKNDVFVVNYVDIRQQHPVCGSQLTQEQLHCAPSAFTSAADQLWLQQPGLTFIASTSIPFGQQDRGFTALVFDPNQDGLPDILIANDGGANRFLINRSAQQFVDKALDYGVAVNASGMAEASMGIAIQSLDLHSLRVLMTHFNRESNTLYESRQFPYFNDISHRFQLHRMSHDVTSWGVMFADLDNRGQSQIVVLNGHVEPIINRVESQVTYAQPNHILYSTASGVWQRQTLPGALQSSRGLAVADLNNDGGLDLVMTHIDARPEVLWNTSQRGNWIAFQLNPEIQGDALIGTQLAVTAGKQTQYYTVHKGGSYLSDHAAPIHIGLNNHAESVQVMVFRHSVPLWPAPRTYTVNQKHVIPVPTKPRP